ncbi:hypothetical protein SY83_11335 [Paenibacillus swuensis]|uniref:SGNH hydrolase-type esterase domain-containing protein n=1 Tax=Paenibacillus swuensis TaxID=1178515 RepID=A0A172TI93_9BACL|nr:hypothetical protein [Paenibacillus swuensis]ANE46768.1 hypothetical protein SY83_11335 [Paenibacillus swuensis]
MSYRKFLLIFSAFTVLFASGVMAAFYTVDPLQYYRQASAYPPLYSFQERYQNPGLARNYDYDTIILGTSMTQCFRPSHVDSILGGKTLKLSIEGSYSQEQNLIANVALKTGKVKRVIWGLDYFALREGKDIVREDQGPFPYFLYDDNPLNDYKYLLNVTTMKMSWEILKGEMEGNRRVKNLDLLNNWDYQATYGAKPVMENYKKALELEPELRIGEDTFEEVKTTFEENVYDLVKAHPDVEFIFFYPPYSILRQQVWHELNPDRYQNQELTKKYIVDRFSAMPNVQVYDFQSAKDVTFNLANYKDVSHYSEEINVWMLKNFKTRKYLARPDNIEQTLTALNEQVEALDVSVLAQQTDAPVKQ